MTDPQIIVALDFPDPEQALVLAKGLDPKRCRLKVGKELFTRSGPRIVEQLMALDFDVFLDLKYHDIPTTVAKACQAAAELGVWMLNVHALGGEAMMHAAKAAIEKCQHQPLLIGVTLLTSMDQQTFEQLGFKGSIQQRVIELADQVAKVGLNGIVCSAQEAAVLRQHYSGSFKLVTPGIRLNNSHDDDQHRIMTPEAAIDAGSSYLVIGRPITAATDPLSVLMEIERRLAV